MQILMGMESNLHYSTTLWRLLKPKHCSQASYAPAIPGLKVYSISNDWCIIDLYMYLYDKGEVYRCLGFWDFCGKRFNVHILYFIVLTYQNQA